MEVQETLNIQNNLVKEELSYKTHNLKTYFIAIVTKAVSGDTVTDTQSNGTYIRVQK